MKNVQLKDKQTKENIYPVNNLDSTVVDGSETKTWRDVIKNSSGGGTSELDKHYKNVGGNIIFDSAIAIQHCVYGDDFENNASTVGYALNKSYYRSLCIDTSNGKYYLCGIDGMSPKSVYINSSAFHMQRYGESKYIGLGNIIKEIEDRITALEKSSTK